MRRFCCKNGKMLSNQSTAAAAAADTAEGYHIQS